MIDFFNFKDMVSTGLIKLVYAIGALFLTGVGLKMIWPSFRGEPGGDLTYGILYLTVGNIVWRVLCEWIIIVFSIHERLANIETSLNERPLVSIAGGEKKPSHSLVSKSLRN